MMQAQGPTHAANTSMTLHLACLFSAASAGPSISTGKEGDTESGNDYFEARYYSSAMGRFLSPDWSAQEEPVPYATFDDPQSLNLYSYVRNNPLSRTDADGHRGDICGWFITTVSTYVATHPEVGQALQKLGDSVGIKLTAGVGRKVTIGGRKTRRCCNCDVRGES